MQPNRNILTNAGPPLMYKHISLRFRKARHNFLHQIRPAFLFLKDIINLKLTWGGSTAKFNSRKIYLEGATAKFNTHKTFLEDATAKFNTRETQKFCGFLEPQNLVPAKCSTFKVISRVPDIGISSQSLTYL